MEYASFSDESRHSEGRYRSIAAVSLPAESVIPFSTRLSTLLGYGRRRELKWGRVGDPRGDGDEARAIAALDFLLEHLTQSVRADVLTWDTQDERHSVPNRDDIANYERMFYHLHHALIKRRGLDSVWHIRPDEQVTIDWTTIHQCLSSNGTWRRDLDPSTLSDDLRSLAPVVRTFLTVKSVNSSLCQLADLLAGIAAYTRTHSEVVKRLMRAAPGQHDLFGTPESGRAKRRDLVRFRVIEHLNQQCKLRRLGVSLREHGYFRTHDPEQPLNFWHYIPQHGMDKAPTRTQTGNGLRETMEGSPYSAR